MDDQPTAAITERSDADAQKDRKTGCQDHCRGEERQQGCDGTNRTPRLLLVNGHKLYYTSYIGFILLIAHSHPIKS